MSDTTMTKLFVGGLSWDTKSDTLHQYFSQFGPILEAVVLVDKQTGRSKGYGFVTFVDAQAAQMATANPNPTIDGRRANCNLAALGAKTRAPMNPFASQGYPPPSHIDRNSLGQMQMMAQMQPLMSDPGMFSFMSPQSFHPSLQQGGPIYYQPVQNPSFDPNVPLTDPMGHFSSEQSIASESQFHAPANRQSFERINMGNLNSYAQFSPQGYNNDMGFIAVHPNGYFPQEFESGAYNQPVHHDVQNTPNTNQERAIRDPILSSYASERPSVIYSHSLDPQFNATTVNPSVVYPNSILPNSGREGNNQSIPPQRISAASFNSNFPAPSTKYNNPQF